MITSRSYLTVIVLLAIGATLSAQPRYATSGKEFYIGFASNYYLNVAQQTDTMELMILGDVTAMGLVEVPALKFSQSFTVTPGFMTTVGLPSGNGEGSVVIGEAGAVVKGLAVHVTSNQNITVVGLNHKVYSSDAFLAYPTQACGTTYRAMSFENSVDLPSLPPSEFMPGEFLVASAHDSTHINITPRARTNDGHRADSSFTVSLSKGDLYEVQSDIGVAAGDLTGSFISSDKPIALFSGHSRTQIPSDFLTAGGGTSRNHLIEQLLPLDLWEDSAVVVPLADQSGQGIARIVAGYDSTVVSIVRSVDSTQRVVLDAGQFYQFDTLTSQPHFVTATHPIEVAQYLHTNVSGISNGDPAMVMTPSLTHMDTSLAVAVSDNATFTTHDVTLLLSARDSLITIDGHALPIIHSLTPVPQSPYFYISFSMNYGEHFISIPHPFNVMTYGMGQVDAYAYSGGMPVRLHPFSEVAESFAKPYSAALVFPNPTAGWVTIADVLPSARVIVMDALGREINVAMQSSSAGRQLDLTKLPGGVYLVIIESNGIRRMERVVRE